MKIKNGFVLRTICGEHVVSGEGLEQVNFSHFVNLNETAAYLWEALEGKEFTAETMAKLLLDRYEVDAETARADAEKLAARWIELGLVDA